MNRFTGALILLSVVLTFGTLLAVEAKTVTKDVKVTRKCVVRGKTIAEGNYTVSFADDQDGELVISKGGREVARSNYKLLKLYKGAAESVLVFSVQGDGSYRISRIEFKGYNLALDLE